ncbi:MAG: Nif3-like dinuclear metal center hexameric protein [Bacillota bacterium]
MSYFQAAQRKGAQCFITGDVKFHEGQHALAMGMAIIDAGHYADRGIIYAGTKYHIEE